MKFRFSGAPIDLTEAQDDAAYQKYLAGAGPLDLLAHALDRTYDALEGREKTMSYTDPAYRKRDGTIVYRHELRRDVADFAPHTKGEHIRTQLNAIGRLQEFLKGTTPWLLPYTWLKKPRRGGE